jgi:hypothetical protein
VEAPAGRWVDTWLSISTKNKNCKVHADWKTKLALRWYVLLNISLRFNLMPAVSWYNLISVFSNF